MRRLCDVAASLLAWVAGRASLAATSLAVMPTAVEAVAANVQFWLATRIDAFPVYHPVISSVATIPTPRLRCAPALGH